MYDVVIDDDVAIGVRFTTPDDETRFLSFLSLFSAAAAAAALSPSDNAAITPTPDSAPDTPKPFLHCLNIVRTNSIPGVKRGARTKAIAICTQHSSVHVYKPLLLMALDEFFKTPEIGVIQQLYDNIMAMDLTNYPVLSKSERRIVRAAGGADALSGVDRRFFATKVRFGKTDIPMKLPVTLHEDEVGDVRMREIIGLSEVGGEFGGDSWMYCG